MHEENTVLSHEGALCWPMEEYEEVLEDPGYLALALADAKCDYQACRDHEDALRLGGLELLRDVLNGI